MALSPSSLSGDNLRAAPWQILGAGSIGCLFAAYLQRAGIAVRLLLRETVGRDDAETRIATLTLQRGSAADAAQQQLAVPAIGIAQLQGPLQKILICTKAQHTVAAVTTIRNSIAADALLVLLQNGMGVREQLAELLPHATILHALTTEGAYKTERFHIVHAGRGATVIGAALASQRPIADYARDALCCELTIDAIDDIDSRLWSKLAVNSVINPLTALHDCRNGELPNLPGIEPVITALCAEAAAVANAEGQCFEAAQLIDNVYAVCRVTADNRSSMLQDLTLRRRSEIDFINGYILQRAAQHGIDCPQQNAVFTALKQRERALNCR